MLARPRCSAATTGEHLGHTQHFCVRVSSEYVLRGRLLAALSRLPEPRPWRPARPSELPLGLGLPAALPRGLGRPPLQPAFRSQHYMYVLVT